MSKAFFDELHITALMAAPSAGRRSGHHTPSDIKKAAALFKAADCMGVSKDCCATAFFLLPSPGRKSLFISILRNQSYFQTTSILLICKINKKVAHTDLLGGTTFQIHMSI